jgi:DNA helicase IV
VANQSSIEKELANEQEYVDLVLTHFQRAIDAAHDLAQESRALFTSDRDTWMREELGTAILERDTFSYVAARRLAQLEGEREGLVFGRLDFLHDSQRYIGRLGVRTQDYEPLVIDWRAQAAEPFYRATPIEPMDVVRRRVLTSRNDRVTGIEDDVLIPGQIPDDMVVVGDGALMAALDRARGATMHDIVATIQAEQDKVIRAPHQGYTIITGGPGTGKTVVGLHRIAFLMYTHRTRFTNGGVLVIGPSSIFIDYIEKVLPALGEESITLQSVGQVAHDVLGFSSSIRDASDAWAIKGDLAMVGLLKKLVKQPLQEDQQLRVVVHGEVFFLTAEMLNEIRLSALRKHPYNQARKLARAQVVEAFLQQAQERGLVKRPNKTRELIKSSWEFGPFFQQWWPVLTPVKVLSRLADEDLLKKLGGLTLEQARILSKSIDPEHPTVGDIPLLDELAHLLGPLPKEKSTHNLFSDDPDDQIALLGTRNEDQQPRKGVAHTTFAHVLVDEAQDITPMQWRMIHRRGSQASWTIVGDVAQSSWPDRDVPLQTLTTLMGNREKRFFRLSTNYRSPKEAYELATAYITEKETDCDIPQSVRSTGIQPRCVVSPRSEVGPFVADEINQLCEQVEGTIGLICEKEYSDLIQPHLPQLNRLMVIDALSAKGLEFDAVVIVDPDGITSTSLAGPRILYVALTRPTQILVTVDIDNKGLWRAGLAQTSPD